MGESRLERSHITARKSQLILILTRPSEEIQSPQVTLSSYAKRRRPGSGRAVLAPSLETVYEVSLADPLILSA